MKGYVIMIKNWCERDYGMTSVVYLDKDKARGELNKMDFRYNDRTDPDPDNWLIEKNLYIKEMDIL